MTLRDFYLARMKQEAPVFQHVLKALPADALSYKPHEKSPSAEQLVYTIASGRAASVELIDTQRIERTKIAPPPLNEMIALVERANAQLMERVPKMDDAAWNQKGKLYFDGKLMMEPVVGEFLWFLLFDGIHHRGQLSAYMRPMGAKVPSIYGPSADDPGR
jgi:uncharacterized damage-inducible protein DinB